MSPVPPSEPKSPNRTRLILLAAALLTGAAILVGPGRARANVPPPPVTPPAPATAVTMPPPDITTTPPQPERPSIEVVFVLDTTGSMGGLIEGAKQKIWSIASEIARGQPTPILKVGLVAYRDVGDEYVTRRFQLTNDLDSMFVNLRRLTADGGGDTPEHVGRALGEAVSRMSWSQDAKTMKLIYLVGDAPAHNDYNDGWNANTWARRAAQKGITIHAVRCGVDAQTQMEFTRLAQVTSGSFMSIHQSGGMVVKASPYDAELKRLNAAIAAKTMYAGEKSARDATRHKVSAMEAMPAASQADRMSFFGSAKGAGLAPSAAPAPEAGAVDLTASPAKAGGMPASAMPEELQGMGTAERVQKLQQMKQEREELEKKAEDVSRARADWMNKNAKDKDDAFDSKVKESLKSKAADYGIKY